MRKYRADFLIRLVSGDYLILEVKGQDSEQDQVKRRFLDEWVKAVNEQGGFGPWHWEVSKNPAALPDLLGRYRQQPAA
jgi:type III restriction enzyme